MHTTASPTPSTPTPNGIVVYCASAERLDRAYSDTAREMGRLIAAGGYRLITGGGYRGLMAASIEGALEAGGQVTGVLPAFMVERGWAHPRLSDTIVTDTMHRRKATMASMSCAAVALAGGIGTLDELCEIMTWRQLGLFAGPVVLVNTLGYYDPFIAMLERMSQHGFMRGGTLPLHIAATPAQAMDIIKEAAR